MPYTVKIIRTKASSQRPLDYASHESAVKSYLDAATITTLHSVTTVVYEEEIITTIVFE